MFGCSTPIHHETAGNSAESFTALLEIINTGSHKARTQAEFQLYENLSSQTPGEELKKFQQSFAEFRGNAMGGIATREQFDMYCQMVETLIGDLGRAKDPATAQKIRSLLWWSTAYSAYEYKSWQTAWPWLKSTFENRRKSAI